MKMPDGWKRLKEYSNINVDGTYLSNPELGVQKAVTLMAEMAEALDLAVFELQYYGKHPVNKKIKDVLKKWEEWN